MLAAVVLTIFVVAADVLMKVAVSRGGRAAHARAPVERIADRLTGYLVGFGVAAACVTAVATRDSRATIAVAIVVGFSGISVAIPLAVGAAIRRAARSGAIINGGSHLESLWAIDTVVLDKIGAVAVGDLRVQTVYPSKGASVKELLEAAAIAESRCEHPIGRAITRHAVDSGIVLRERGRLLYEPGRGVRATCSGEEILVGSSTFVTAGRFLEPTHDASGLTTVFVVRAGRYLGSLVLADRPRPEARRAIAALRALKIRTWLLTGDSRLATEFIARELGVDDFESGVTPDAKLARVRALRAKARVAMIGDGLTDAPALRAANVGIALGAAAGSERADINLVGPDLLGVVGVIRLARRTRRVILQNFLGTVIVDGVGVALAATGVLTPITAALVHVTTELVFILNAARLTPRPSRDSSAGQTSIQSTPQIGHSLKTRSLR